METNRQETLFLRDLQRGYRFHQSRKALRNREVGVGYHIVYKPDLQTSAQTGTHISDLATGVFQRSERRLHAT